LKSPNFKFRATGVSNKIADATPVSMVEGIPLQGPRKAPAGSA